MLVLSWKFALMIALGASLTAPSTGDRARLILTRARQALNPGSKIPAWRMTGTIRSGALQGSATLWTDARRPAYAEYDRGPADLTGASGYNGSLGWTAGTDGVQQMAIGLPRSVLAGTAYVLSAAIVNARNTRFAKLTTSTTDADIIRFSPPSVAPFDVWFSRATGFPAKAVFYGEDTHTYLFSDYRAVGASVLPFFIQEDDQIVQIRAVERISEASIADAVPTAEPCGCGISGDIKTIIPVRSDGRHVLVSVRLNGQGPFRFILDSGGHNLMSREVAKQLRMKISGFGMSGGIGSSTVPVSFTTVDRVAVGRAYMLRQPFKIMDIRNGFGRSFSDRIDGVIGFQLLMRFRTTIDYAANRLTLSLDRSPIGSAIPFTFFGDMPAVEATLGKRKGWFGLDTGSGASLSLFKPFWKAQYPPATKRVYGSVGLGVGGSQDSWFAPVSDLKWSHYHFPVLIADFSNATSGDLAVSSVAGDFGGALLSRFSVTFDYRAQKLQLLPNSSFNEPQRLEGSGINVMRSDHGVLIYTVLTGSPGYDAGVRGNMTLESIDGRSVRELSLEQIRQRLKPSAGTGITIQTMDRGVSRIFRFATREFLH